MAGKASNKKIAGGLLAAGSSQRMGKINKLLFEIKGVPMVRKIAIEMLKSNLDSCFAVTGYESERVAKALEGLPIKIIKNHQWKDGQGTSVSKVAKKLNNDSADLMIMLGDLPSVKAEHFNYLIKSHTDIMNSEFTITIPEYRGLKGNPVIWGRSYISQLKELSGELGGRKLFKKYLKEINSVEINSDCIISDVDTSEALDLLVKRTELS